jgi:hypothetical protein
LRASFIEVQNAIDQIDKAIEDEEKPAPSVPGFKPGQGYE